MTLSTIRHGRLSHLNPKEIAIIAAVAQAVMIDWIGESYLDLLDVWEISTILEEEADEPFLAERVMLYTET